ncbi:NAD(+)/NADH kinase [Boudabousia marimammalium]|uniref:NAD kinase n=1 Tax=Boudabousia marimammalium TaxID=156892 RepID=A0A1Q5PR30_9ACTO|nr:NAD(+)/NADH kinase [Boudabousia marimammalium]OKL50081.1 hypothetical protein BM477_04145 [Boudabousia marimammalium]
MVRTILLIQHATREEAIKGGEVVRATCASLGLQVVERAAIDRNPDIRVDLVIALGGDGTLLAAADYGRRQGVPIIGFNTGRMGFLTEVGAEDFRAALVRLAEEDFTLDIRQTIEVTVKHRDGRVEEGWALNEAAVMHSGLDHPADFTVGVDGLGLSRYAADGIIIATPTGSTAYSYSAGGPIVWPNVESMLLVPLAAHGLFRTPLVVGCNSVLQVEIDVEQPNHLEIWFDGQRMLPVEPGALVEARISPNPVVLAALSEAPFSARLVSKFQLPVDGWRSGTSA